MPVFLHSVVTPVDTSYTQGLDRVLSGRLRNPVCPTRFRLDLQSKLTISLGSRHLCRNFVGKLSLIANITRCFFWLGDQFETPLLLQSIFMILAQVRTVLSPTHL